MVKVLILMTRFRIASINWHKRMSNVTFCKIFEENETLSSQFCLKYLFFRFKNWVGYFCFGLLKFRMLNFLIESK